MATELQAGASGLCGLRDKGKTSFVFSPSIFSLNPDSYQSPGITRDSKKQQIQISLGTKTKMKALFFFSDKEYVFTAENS